MRKRKGRTFLNTTSQMKVDYCKMLGNLLIVKP